VKNSPPAGIFSNSKKTNHMPPNVRGINNRSIPQATEKGEVDRYGVSMLARDEYFPASEFPRLLRAVGSPHPRFVNMEASKASFDLTHAGTFYKASYLYEGFLLNLPEPTYELGGGVSEESIETHPNFETTIGGTPSEPLNNAIFVDKDNQPTTDDEKGIFAEFGRCIMAGVEAYRIPTAIWTKTSFSQNRPSVLRNLGKIESPDGPNPTLGSRIWMVISSSYRKRGRIYELRESWEMLGEGESHELIY
jgi:hypothetical protein